MRVPLWIIKPRGAGNGFCPLSRESWIAAALSVLEKRGIAAVKIDALAKRFRVTRGSFYFHFSGLDDLREALLETWRSCNCHG